MADEGFASTLLKNLKAVRFGKDGGIDVPVRANGKDGIVVGLDAIAERESAHADEPSTTSPVRTGWRRFFRH